MAAELRLHRALADAKAPLLAVAESCTGGLIAERITRQAGSSAYFDRGLVTYANAAKTALLGVDSALLEGEDAPGAVSRACAEAMLQGLFDRHGAKLGASVTGIAGPDGGTADKPVGAVWIAWGRPGAVRCELLRLSGDRESIRARSADAVLERLADLAEETGAG